MMHPCSVLVEGDKGCPAEGTHEMQVFFKTSTRVPELVQTVWVCDAHVGETDPDALYQGTDGDKVVYVEVDVTEEECVGC